MSSYHTPVLLEESIALLDIKSDGTYADLTFGGGGHTRAAGCTITAKSKEDAENKIISVFSRELI